MKKFLKKFGSKIVAAGTAVCAIVATSITAFAEDSTDVAGAMSNAISSGASSAVSSITGMLTTIAPLIIGIVVGVVVLAAGIKWLKKIRSNAA